MKKIQSVTFQYSHSCIELILEIRAIVKLKFSTLVVKNFINVFFYFILSLRSKLFPTFLTFKHFRDAQL